MGVRPVISRGNVLNPIGVRRKLITFFEPGALRVIGIIDCDGLSAVLFHDGETRNIGRPVADVDLLGKGIGRMSKSMWSFTSCDTLSRPLLMRNRNCVF